MCFADSEGLKMMDKLHHMAKNIWTPLSSYFSLRLSGSVFPSTEYDEIVEFNILPPLCQQFVFRSTKEWFPLPGVQAKPSAAKVAFCSFYQQPKHFGDFFLWAHDNNLWHIFIFVLFRKIVESWIVIQSYQRELAECPGRTDTLGRCWH